MGTSPRAVVFDFDYTLADSSQGVRRCVDYAFGELGLPARRPDEINRTIGLPLTEAFRWLAPTADPALASRFQDLFLRHAEKVMVELTVVYAPVPAVLQALRAAGLALAIVSTKHRVRIEAILDRAGLRGGFAAIVGGEDVTRHKPDPCGLAAAMVAVGSDAASTIYVGDSAVDADTAQRAGTRFVATLTGTTTREQFAPFAVDAFIQHLGELPRVLRQRPCGGPAGQGGG